MTTPPEDVPDAERIRIEVVQKLQAGVKRIQAIQQLQRTGTELSLIIPAVDGPLAARMDEVGWLLTIAQALLADPNGRSHHCSVCHRSERPMRPLGLNTEGGGLQWACMGSCLIYLVMGT